MFSGKGTMTLFPPQILKHYKNNINQCCTGTRVDGIMEQNSSENRPFSTFNI